MTWKPHLTTAVIVPRDGKYLMVEERSQGRIVLNQPAGHIEPGESILEAAQRETLEETGWQVQLTHFLGLYTYLAPANGVTYFRFCFLAEPRDQVTTELDTGIIAAHWLGVSALRSRQQQLRSPLVLKCIEDYRTGQRYPLELIQEFHIPG